VRSSSSWRSLLATLGFAYGGGLITYCVVSPVVCFVSFFIMLFLMAVDALLGIGVAGGAGRLFSWVQVASCLALAVIFVIATIMLIRSAEYRVSILDRIKHWKDEPRRPRRVPVVRQLERPRRHDGWQDY